MCSIENGAGERKDGASGEGGWATLPTVERLCTRLKGFSLDFISHPITWYTRGRERERERRRRRGGNEKEGDREKERGSRGHRCATRAWPRCKNILNVAATLFRLACTAMV